MQNYFILFIFIIIIIFALFLRMNSEAITILAIIFVLFVGLLFDKNLEQFTEIFPDNEVVKNNQTNFDFNDSEISKYGNIVTSEDIDMTKQENGKLNFSQNPNSNEIDNADVIEQAITRGVSLFHPNGTGYSPLKGIANTPSMFANYNLPPSGQQDADEMLSRKQQQRSAINKRALDGAVRATRDLYCKYFTEELNENEHRVWYSAEAQDIETDWSPSG